MTPDLARLEAEIEATERAADAAWNRYELACEPEPRNDKRRQP
jgi:hypothetical protein